MRKHGWKTPYELIIEHSPDLSHLHQYGCKAYTLDKHIPRKSKMQERAHIGYLVDYEARNIFRIWIPSQRKIIRTRDVMFDDKTTYDAHDIDLLQAVKEPMLETVFEAHNLNPITQITEIESDEEESEDNPKHTDESREFDQSKDKNVGFLPTSGPSEMTSASTVPPTPTSFRPTSDAPAPAPSPPTNKASKNSADFDSANILPEGVSRHRKRRQAYSTALVSRLATGYWSHIMLLFQQISWLTHILIKGNSLIPHFKSHINAFIGIHYLPNLSTIVSY